MVLYKKHTSSDDIESKFETKVIELERKLERLMDMQERLKSQLEDLIGMQDGLKDRQTEVELEFEKFKVSLCDKDEDEGKE